MLEDTIIAVATPPGFGGLGVVRVSGREALRVAGRIFAPREKIGKSFPVRRPVFGAVRDPEGGPGLDEGFLTYFKAPRSYTREDVVEISVHGSPAVLEAVLLLGTRAGARLAGPGEFTLRAYLNGRLDIIQAQAVDDLVRSVSLTQARVSSRQLGGSLSRRMAKLRARLVSLLARIEAGLEFPEEGLRTSAGADRKALAALAAETGRLAAGAEAGRAIGEGISLAIAGRTNVGKSTLFNALLEEDRAIVTPYPGTTRDYLRERVVIDGIVVHLIDMAGLGRTSHPVERSGIARGRKIAHGADGVLVVLDASRKAGPDDRELFRRYARKKVLVVLNKTDLPRKLDAAAARRLAGPAPVVEVSALKGTNIDGLRAAIRSSFLPGHERAEEVVLHARQRDCLRGIQERLESAGRLLDEGHSGEVYAEEVRAALRLVGEMTGEVRADEVLEDIFGRFCVGK